MAYLPDRSKLRQLRIRAKELKRAVDAGEQDALDRVLTSHPKFAGRPAERMEGWRFTLRDAQATIARELGFDSWRALLAKVEGEPRWDPTASGISRRAFVEAQSLGHRFCTDLHFLLALLKPPAPTVAADVLAELGISYEKVRERLEEWNPRSRRKGTGVSSTPTYQLILGWAQGIAIGMGASRMSDEHILLGLVYGDIGGGSRIISFGVDPDEVVAGLRARGIQTPKLEPPIASTPAGPMGPWVYFPKEDWSAVTQELVKDYPPGSLHWGTNRSRWKRHHWYVHGEDGIPMEAIVLRAVKDKRAIEVLLVDEGMKREIAAASIAID